MDTIPLLKDADHVRGSLAATLLLMTYGDYQCPKSGQAHEFVEHLRSSLGEQLCFIFRHFPQTDRHPQSQKAAETAEAAASQGLFWEMHDQLFENQQALDDASLVEYAVKLGLDISQFLQELAGHTHAQRIQDDVESAKQCGVQEAPTFFISLRHEGTKDLETVIQRILNVALSIEE